MAWPASRQTLVDAFKDGDRAMLTVKEILERLSAASAAGPVRRHEILNAKKSLEKLDTLLTTTIGYGAAAVAYAQTAYRDPTLDVAAEYTAVRDAVRALAAWIGTAMPNGTDITEYNSGDLVDLTFSTATLAQFRTNVGTLAALIN